MEFDVCAGCRRHVRRGAAACPFCGGEAARFVCTDRRSARASRTALMASAVAVVTLQALESCSSVPAYGDPWDGAIVSQDAGSEATDGGGTGD